MPHCGYNDKQWAEIKGRANYPQTATLPVNLYQIGAWHWHIAGLLHRSFHCVPLPTAAAAGQRRALGCNWRIHSGSIRDEGREWEWERCACYSVVPVYSAGVGDELETGVVHRHAVHHEGASCIKKVHRSCISHASTHREADIAA